MMGEWQVSSTRPSIERPGLWEPIPGLTAQLIEIWEAYRRADDGFVMAARYV